MKSNIFHKIEILPPYENCGILILEKEELILYAVYYRNTCFKHSM